MTFLKRILFKGTKFVKNKKKSVLKKWSDQILVRVRHGMVECKENTLYGISWYQYYSLFIN